MKRILIVFAITFLAGISLYCQAKEEIKIPFDDIAQPSSSLLSASNDSLAVQSHIGIDIYIGALGGFGGFIAGTAIPIDRVLSTIYFTKPDGTAGSYTYNNPSNEIIALSTIAGAAILVGLYELGHRLLRWW